MAEILSADVGVRKTAPAQAAAGAPFTYTLTVSNAGPDAATLVHLADPLPTGTTFAALSQSGAGPWICTTPAVGANGAVACDVPTLAAGASTTFTLTVAIAGNVPLGTNVVNVATVTSATADPVLTNAGSTATAQVSVPAIPTVDAVGLVVLALAIGGLAFIRLRRA